MRPWKFMWCIVVMSVTAFAITRDLPKEQQIETSIEAHKAAKAAFKIEVDKVLAQVGKPMIEQSAALVAQGRAIMEETKTAAKAAGVADPNDFVNLVSNACDQKTIEHKEAVLSLLIEVIRLASEELTK